MIILHPRWVWWYALDTEGRWAGWCGLWRFRRLFTLREKLLATIKILKGPTPL